MPRSIFRLAGATALAATLAAGAGHASVVVSDAFAGQEATQGKPVVLDVDGNGIDDLEINVFVPIVVDPGDIQNPGPLVPLSIEIDEPVNGDNGIYLPTMGGEGARLNGLSGFSNGVTSSTTIATVTGSDWGTDAKAYAPGETVDEGSAENFGLGGRLYGPPTLGFPGPIELSEPSAF